MASNIHRHHLVISQLVLILVIASGHVTFGDVIKTDVSDDITSGKTSSDNRPLSVASNKAVRDVRNYYLNSVNQLTKRSQVKRALEYRQDLGKKRAFEFRNDLGKRSRLVHTAESKKFAKPSSNHDLRNLNESEKSRQTYYEIKNKGDELDSDTEYSDYLEREVSELEENIKKRKVMLAKDLSKRGIEFRQDLGKRGMEFRQDLGKRGMEFRQDLGKRGIEFRHDFGKRGFEFRQDLGKRGMEFRQDLGKRGIDFRQDLGKRGMEFRQDLGKRGMEFRNDLGK